MVRPAVDFSSLLEKLRRTRMLLAPEELVYRQPERVSTGFDSLDRLLGGGFPLGKLIALRGAIGSAAISLSMIARLTREGRWAAWVDRLDRFDPWSAAQAGVDLSRLLWCRPVDTKAALRAVDALLASGVFPLVMLDLEPVRSSSTISSSAWMRLARDAEAARGSLVVLGGHGSFAAASLRILKGCPRFVGRPPGRVLDGFEVSVALEENRLGLPPGEAKVYLRAPEHFPCACERCLAGTPCAPEDWDFSRSSP